MPDNFASIILRTLFLGIGVFAITRVLIKAVRSKHGPVKTVAAVVADKEITETFSKYAGNSKKAHYIVVFSVGSKKKAFYVSQFSYNGYRIGEKGMLKYQGERIIDFK